MRCTIEKYIKNSFYRTNKKKLLKNYISGVKKIRKAPIYKVTKKKVLQGSGAIINLQG